MLAFSDSTPVVLRDGRRMRITPAAKLRTAQFPRHPRTIPELFEEYATLGSVCRCNDFAGTATMLASRA